MNLAPRDRWMRQVLLLAAVYNIGWGVFVVCFPLTAFRWAGMAPPNYPQLWQCIGMIVGVYGIGYAIAAADPYRHWPIVLVGLLGKVFGPIGYFWYASRGDLPWSAGWTIVANDLIWWLPFVAILRQVWRVHLGEENEPAIDLLEALATTRTHAGATLDELAQRSPLLVVFFRHFG